MLKHLNTVGAVVRKKLNKDFYLIECSLETCPKVFFSFFQLLCFSLLYSNINFSNFYDGK